MSKKDPTRPPFVPSVITEAVIKALGKAEPGDIVTYEQIDSVAQCDVRAESRHSFTTARNSLRREHRMVFENIRDVGYRLIPNNEISPITWRKKSKAIRRVAVDGRKDHLAIAVENLPPDMRSEAIARTTVFHLIARTSTQRTVRNFLPTVREKFFPENVPTMVKRLLSKSKKETDATKAQEPNKEAHKEA